jgi:hypothetical protein
LRYIKLRFLGIPDWWDAMRRVGFAAAIVTIFAVNVASAACYGTDTFQHCDEGSGTGYTINRFGDTSMMTGGNAQAGGSWPQNPITFGDTTFHNDRASSGNSWNATDQRLEDSRHIFSRDRQGNSSSRICGLLDRC